MRTLFLPIALAVGFLASLPGQEANPADLRQLIRDLADEAYEHLVVTDPGRRVYGMAYEFKAMPGGPQIQDFGLDSMHDGAWLMSALVTAHRIDPDGGHLERVQGTQAPFNINVLRHSDRLFPHMLPREGQETFDAPIKGWAPRGWDDGPGIDLVTAMRGEPQPFSSGVNSHPNGTVIERDAGGNFQHAYFTSSHHLLQDLADALLNVWLTTRDPAAAEAVMLIHENRLEHGLRIPVVQVAAGFMIGDARLAHRRPEPFDPARAFRPIWQGVARKEPASFGHYSDGLGWELRAEIARSALAGEPIPDGFLVNAVGQVFSAARVAEVFHGDAWEPGMTLPGNAIRFEKGDLVRKANEEAFYDSRGIQFAWIGAALLPEFRKRAGAWDTAIASLSETDRQVLRDFTGNELTHAAVVAALEADIDGTLRHWAAVREDLGYLPRMIKTNRKPFSWSRWMELGAYAHLVKLAAFRLMDREGTDETQLIRQQAPASPLPHEPLPDSVLRIQGLK